MPVPARFIAAIRQMAFLYGPDGRIAEANDLAEALAGRALAGSSRAEVLEWFRMRHLSGRPFAQAEMPASRALAGEEAVDVPLVATAGDNREIHVLATASPLRDGDAVTGALVVWQDVTGLVAAEKALRESEARFRLVLTNAATAVFHQDRDLRYTWYGHPHPPFAGTDLVGMTDADLMAPEDAAPITALKAEVLATGEARRGEVSVTVDGATMYVDLAVEPVRDADGRTVGVMGVSHDITELKLAEAALKESEERQAFLLRLSDAIRPLADAGAIQAAASRALGEHLGADRVLYGELDPDGERITVEHGYAEGVEVWTCSMQTMGFGTGFMDALRAGRNILVSDTAREDCVPAGAQAAFAAAGVRSLAAVPLAKGGRLEAVLLVQQSEPRDWAPAEVATMEETAERMWAAVERARAEDAFRASEARYRALFETMNEGFMVVEPVFDEHGAPVSFRHLEVNPAKARISGRTREELVGRDARETAPEIEDCFVETYTRVATTGEPAHLEAHARGLGCWLSVDVYSPEPGKAAVVVSDITARKEAERRQAFLLALGDRLRELDDVAAIAAEASERVGRYLGASGAVYCEIDDAGECATVRADWTDGTVPSATGHFRMDDFDIGDLYRRGEVRRTTDVAAEHDRDEAEKHCTLKIRASLGVPILRAGKLATVLAVHSARPREWTEAEVELVREAGGRIWAAVERARAEASLREYAENLRRSNEDLQRFAYVASHDLQEPLRSIISFSQLLERRCKGQLGTDADEYIDFIVEGGSRMQGLILDLLAFSRVNTTRQQIARTDAEDVLAETVRALDVSLREAGATLTHDPLPVVLADPTQLAQVFSNLVSNAIKFRKPDVPLHIHVGVRRADGFCEFSVSDNGIGIEPEYFEKIFVIFQRLHTKETYPGTGIGLAIVKRIIDRHGGTIRVESVPGEGSTFFFTLPAA